MQLLDFDITFWQL